MTAAHEIISDDPALEEDELVVLARRCWEADGGLPLAVEPWFVRGRWSRPDTRTFTIRTADATPGCSDVAAAGATLPDGAALPQGAALPDGADFPEGASLPDGAGQPNGAGLPAGVGRFSAAGRPGGGLLAAVGVRPGPQGPMITGMVDPAARGYGAGSRLLDAALAVAGESGGDVTVETEGLTKDAEDLFESRGLRQFFAEHVMRIDLTAALPREAGWPARTAVTEWNAATARRFFDVYATSFRERPGFPDPSAEEWIGDTAEDDDFRPEWSLLATLPDSGDAGFVSVAEGWIQQVGVVPAARRTGLGGALIREALRRMAAAGLREGWLCVNVDNPAASLYRRIGFQDVRRRARYRTAGS
ncbi:GNAT family N-acetyltransferase [Actinoplanes sp. NPDC023801]|uniref:GNAT family N-acetyltransferase n=1 Tax=Actinoplanes sp. NPDC023801 TaxID=3154595 RepID=UPI0033EBAE3C